MEVMLGIKLIILVLMDMLVVMPLQLLLEIILASGYANFFLLKFPLIGWKAVQTLYYIDTPPYYS